MPMHYQSPEKKVDDSTCIVDVGLFGITTKRVSLFDLLCTNSRRNDDVTQNVGQIVPELYQFSATSKKGC